MTRYFSVKIIILMLSGFFCQSLWASCTYVSLYSRNIDLGNNIVQRDLPVGGVIATLQAGETTGNLEYCGVGGGNTYYAFTYPGSSSTSISNVYSTNIPGVGILISSSGGLAYTQPANILVVSANMNIAMNGGSPRTIKIVKTGPITSGIFQTGMLAKNYGDDGRDFMEFFVTGGQVTQVACSITTQKVDVPLDPVLQGSFAGVNTTQGDKPFTIGLQCDAGARINASLSFTQNTDTSNNSVINLTGAGSAGVATGVGIQLLYGSTILRNNTNVVLKTSSGGQEFPAGAFTARYFQTKSTVTTGDANATATLNLTYQ